MSGEHAQLVCDVMAMLDADGEGRVDRSALYAFTRGKSAAFAKYARALFAALDTDGDDRLSAEDIGAAAESELRILAKPEILEAFHALDHRQSGALSARDVAALLAAKRLEDTTRVDAGPLLARLLTEAGAEIRITQLMGLSVAQLRLLERAGMEAARTGYSPPELMDTPIDDAWERRVIFEARALSGGMNCAQADILRNAIKWGR